MARYAAEFQCTECQFFNYPMLSDTMTGNYTVVCGNCRHHHYRTIRDGKVTEDRHSKDLGNAELIHVMPSASSKEKRKRGMIAQLRETLSGAGFGTGGDK